MVSFTLVSWVPGESLPEFQPVLFARATITRSPGGTKVTRVALSKWARIAAESESSIVRNAA